MRVRGYILVSPGVSTDLVSRFVPRDKIISVVVNTGLYKADVSSGLRIRTQGNHPVVAVDCGQWLRQRGGKTLKIDDLSRTKEGSHGAVLPKNGSRFRSQVRPIILFERRRS